MKKSTLLLSLLGFATTLCVQTAQAVEQTVRVAFLPDMVGFYEIEENGSYSGYNYEYLMNLAQHTGWDYEFVVIEEGLVSTSLVKAQEMLKEGEIDLLGPFAATAGNFDDFESGEENYGVYRYNLYSARNKYAITCDNYFLQDTLKVALVNGYTDLNNTFIQIMKEAEINLDITYVDTHAVSHEMLFDEKVDTILNLDMSSNAENLDYLTTIQRVPFHFVSTKGNTELMAELDAGIENIEIAEPEIHQILLDKYFGTRYDGDFLLTDEEMKFFETIDSLKVGMLVDVPPYQYQNENGEYVGITVDLLKIYEELIGIPFEIVWMNSHDEIVAASQAGEIDIVGSIPNDYTLANTFHVVLTNPFISASSYLLESTNQAANPEIIKHFVSSNIPYYDENKIQTTFNIEDDFKRLNQNGDVAIFCDPYITAYYTGLYQLDNIEVKAVSDIDSEIVLGVSNHMDINLVGILNRAMLYTDSYLVDQIIFSHTNVTPEYTFWDFINEHAFTINFGIFILGSLVMCSVVNTSKKFKDLSRRDSLTKLFNAGYFHEYAEEKIPKLSSGTLFLIDIDYFKEVNDNFGHHSGDEVIKAVAKNLQLFSPDSSIQARLGGDEFAILTESKLNTEETKAKFANFLIAMANNETKIPVTLSIGAYSFDQALEYKTLYRKADKVLYKVKEEGRNGFLIESDSNQSLENTN